MTIVTLGDRGGTLAFSDADSLIASLHAPIEPRPQQRQLRKLLGAFRRGERLTMLVALQRYDIAALSQRVTELRQMGWKIGTTMIRTPSGKYVAEYDWPEEERK